MTDLETYLTLKTFENYFLLGGALVWLTLETLRPALHYRRGMVRLKHIWRNFVLWIASGFLVGFIVGSYLLIATIWLESNRVGILLLFPLPLWLIGIIGVLLMDFSDYIFHRFSHQYRWIWLFHAVHHSDRHLDFTTSLRAHPGHVLMFLGWRVLFITATGIPIWAAMIRDALGIVANQFHHTNFDLPERIDRWLRPFLITPAVHRLHHRPEIECTNSNFGGLFPWWDRLLGTYQDPSVMVPPRYGLSSLEAKNWHTVIGMFLAPWRARKIPRL